MTKMCFCFFVGVILRKVGAAPSPSSSLRAAQVSRQAKPSRNQPKKNVLCKQRSCVGEGKALRNGLEVTSVRLSPLGSPAQKAQRGMQLEL